MPQLDLADTEILERLKTMLLSSAVKTSVLAFLFLATFSGGFSAEQAQRSLPPTPDPLPSVIAFAQRNQIPLQSIDALQERPAHTGDLAVLLVSQYDGSLQKQWLVEIAVAENNPKEMPQKRPPNTVLYVTTGTRVEFTYSPLTFSLKTHGPFAVNSAPTEVHSITARTVVNGDDLQLGFDAASRVFLKLGEYQARSKNPPPFGLGFQSTPPSEDVVSKTKPRANEMELTPSDERSLAGSIPALVGFFGIAQGTAGLRDIVREIIDLPSVWSVMKRGGRVDTNFNFDGSLMGKMDTPPDQPQRYVLGAELQLNGQSALKSMLVVTQPKPPLLTTAGILTIYAEHPTKPAKHAIIQILAARLAEESR